MKRVLEDELVSLAERILRLKNRADIHLLKKEAGILYEKLSILAFAEMHFGGLKSEVSKTEFKEAFEQQFSDIDEESGHYKSPDGMDYNPDPISEPNTEKIKDIVSQMPPESEQVDLLLAEFEKLRQQHQSNPESENNSKEEPPTNPSIEQEPLSDTDTESKAELEHNTEDTSQPPKDHYPTEDDFNSFGVHYDDLPDFEPKSEDTKGESSDHKKQHYPEQTRSENPSNSKAKPPQPDKIESNLNATHKEKRSLNDKLNTGIKIGLNDRIAFTNQLFQGSSETYNTVLSQLNSMSSFSEVEQFIENEIKPKFNNWNDKEAYEERFMAIIERKFES